MGFWFWDFLRGNRPKMSLKYAIFKICHFSWFGVQKKRSSDARIKKRRPFFVVNYTQKWWNGHLFHMSIIFGRISLLILKIAYFRLIFGRFPLKKPQNQKPIVLMVSTCPKNLTKRDSSFWGTPYCTSTQVALAPPTSWLSKWKENKTCTLTWSFYKGGIQKNKMEILIEFSMNGGEGRM